MEAVALLLLLSIWLLAMLFYQKVPDTIPIHFNFSGEADGWGGKIHLFILAGIGTFVMLLIGLSAYYPLRMTNLRIRFTEENKIPQLILAARLLRTLNILIGLLFILILCSMSASLFSVHSGLFILLVGIVVVLLLLSILVYYLLAWRLR